jgi:hypothetical protein
MAIIQPRQAAGHVLLPQQRLGREFPVLSKKYHHASPNGLNGITEEFLLFLSSIAALGSCKNE